MLALPAGRTDLWWWGALQLNVAAKVKRAAGQSTAVETADCRAVTAARAVLNRLLAA
jgi:hypothetical protein